MTSFIPTTTVRARRRRSTLALNLVLASTLALSACATASVSNETATGQPDDSAVSAAESVLLVDGWVKAVDSGMTGAFGIIENSGQTEITLIGATTRAASMVELHETVMGDSGVMVMQQKDGGFVIAAGSDHELAPGSDHIMLMGVSEALQPGDEVILTLEFSDGSTLDHAFTVKEFTGADEDYVGDMGDE